MGKNLHVSFVLMTGNCFLLLLPYRNCYRWFPVPVSASLLFSAGQLRLVQLCCFEPAQSSSEVLHEWQARVLCHMFFKICVFVLFLLSHHGFDFLLLFGLSSFIILNTYFFRNHLILETESYNTVVCLFFLLLSFLAIF